MADNVRQAQSAGPEVKWTSWSPVSRVDVSAADRLLRDFQIQTLRLIAGLAAACLAVLAARGLILGDALPVADLINAVLFAAILFLLSRRPEWFRLLAWLGLASFFVNSIDGVMRAPAGPVAPFHALLPLVVLYGALLGDLGITVVAMLGVLGLYSGSLLLAASPLRLDVMLISNLCVTTVVTGLAGWGVWVLHRRFARTLRCQADDLQKELDARARLNAVIFHDIRNPLGVLIALTEMCRRGMPLASEDMEQLDEMSRRILAIINSAREMERNAAIDLSELPVGQVWDRLRAVFSQRLAEKQQTLAVDGDVEIKVLTHVDILCNSVLGNILGNAIKFSPRGSEIRLRAEAEGASVRLAIRDRGQGFSAEMLSLGSHGDGYTSRPGTEGETGTAYGLRIAALCLQRLHGRLEIRNHPDGGSEVAVVLGRENCEGDGGR